MAVPTQRITEELISPADLTEDEYYRLLSDERRRIVLQTLTDLELPLSVSELAREVAERETESDAGASVPEIRSVETDLHHVHLPLLDDHGIVEYDWQANHIRRS
ncbi:DUF7344 domain-containing protein [Halopelagius longus]|uniref:DUF7344 domain-containing protein n=1 Tax=Halopelagius longus TaxID=1236180 RepID=A0A1H1C7I7_9EURY|nr:hypothetical protein [Halopelagius longus]RDI71107.1 hypothetical protein DWB78_04820 [Halopelagius longus]SDQ60141.1 hypothetical protein SAMN05216278_2155 [Halopelagius longus]